MKKDEAWGVLEPIIWARSLGLQYVLIEIDDKRVKDAYSGNGRDDTSFGDYIIAGKKILLDSPNISANWVDCPV